MGESWFVGLRPRAVHGSGGKLRRGGRCGFCATWISAGRSSSNAVCAVEGPFDARSGLARARALRRADLALWQAICHARNRFTIRFRTIQRCDVARQGAKQVMSKAGRAVNATPPDSSSAPSPSTQYPALHPDPAAHP